MNRLPLLMLTVVGIGSALYACGSSSSGDDSSIIPYDGGGDVVYIPDTGVDGPDPNAGMGKTFCDNTLGLIQNSVGQCCSAAEKSGLSVDLLKNIDTYLTSCETTLESSIAQHRTAPNTASYTACLNAFKSEFTLPPAANACQGLDAYRPGDVLSVSCATAFTGVVAAGGPCAGDFDCSSSLTCIGYGPGVDGKCSAPQPADGTCGEATSATPPVLDFIFPASDNCANGFYCNGGTCKPSVIAGAACTSDAQCVSGDACIDAVCVTANTDGTRLPTNAYCTTTADCIEGDFCKPESACGVAPCVPIDDGGAPPTAKGVCTPSLANPAACDSTIPHQCQGQCKSAVCATLCTYPN